MTDGDKILEFCGWRDAPGIGLISPEGQDFVPPLDINFYFKYAYPQIPKFERYTFLSLWILEVVNGIDPAEAFGQALLKLIKDR